jgi:hypothetical protein
MPSHIKTVAVLALYLLSHAYSHAQTDKPKFRVLAFYTGKSDLAHISFVHEANTWLYSAGRQYQFTYDSTNDWSRMNDSVLARYQVVLFLDTRPEKAEQRAAFERFLKKGGSFMGFHFSAFALTPSASEQNWNWYHDTLLGSGQYKGNTWRPTAATLLVEAKHPATAHLPHTFLSSPNEWYSWEKDLRNNPDIRILLSIDSSSFPLGTGPKQHEIWHSGYYPVVWTHQRYHMLYINMGHNDMDYGKTNQSLSFQFANETQNRLVVDGLLWLGKQAFSRLQ